MDDNPKLRTFELTYSKSVELLEMFGDTKLNIKSPEDIMERVKNNPFIIILQDGEITRLAEVFTP